MKLLKLVEGFDTAVLKDDFYILSNYIGLRKVNKETFEIENQTSDFSDFLSIQIYKDKLYCLTQTNFLKIYDLNTFEKLLEIRLHSDMNRLTLRLEFESENKISFISYIGNYMEDNSASLSNENIGDSIYSLDMESKEIKKVLDGRFSSLIYLEYAKEYLVRDGNGQIYFWDGSSPLRKTERIIDTCPPRFNSDYSLFVMPTKYGVKIVDKDLNELNQYDIVSDETCHVNSKTLGIFKTKDEFDNKQETKDINLESIYRVYTVKNTLLVLSLLQTYRSIKIKSFNLHTGKFLDEIMLPFIPDNITLLSEDKFAFAYNNNLHIMGFKYERD